MLLLCFVVTICAAMRGTNRNHSLSLSNSKFLRNRASTEGGAMVIAFNLVNLLNIPSVVEISDCEFSENAANAAGGVLVVQLQNIGAGNYVVVKKTNFTNNRGQDGAAAINVGSTIDVQSRQKVRASIFEDWYVILC